MPGFSGKKNRLIWNLVLYSQLMVSCKQLAGTGKVRVLLCWISFLSPGLHPSTCMAGLTFTVLNSLAQSSLRFSTLVSMCPMPVSVSQMKLAENTLLRVPHPHRRHPVPAHCVQWLWQAPSTLHSRLASKTVCFTVSSRFLRRRSRCLIFFLRVPFYVCSEEKRSKLLFLHLLLCLLKTALKHSKSCLTVAVKFNILIIWHCHITPWCIYLNLHSVCLNNYALWLLSC